MSDHQEATIDNRSEDPQKKAKDLWCEKALGADPRALIKERLAKLSDVSTQLRVVGGSSISKAHSDTLESHFKDSQEAANEQQRVALADVGKKVDSAIATAQQELKAIGNRAIVAGSIDLINYAMESIEGMGQGDIKEALWPKLIECTRLVSQIEEPTEVDQQQTACLELEKKTHELVHMTSRLGSMMNPNKPLNPQEAYRSALRKRYGITTAIPRDMKQTHLDRVYKMLELVPIQHSKTLKELEYDSGEKYSGYYTVGSAKITLGRYSDQWSQNQNYEPEGTGPGINPGARAQDDEPEYSFDMATLHETGHCVDDKYKIMTGELKAACGGWNDESVDSVAKTMVDDFMANAGSSLQPKLVAKWVKEALQKGAVVKKQELGGMKTTRVPKYDGKNKPTDMKDQEWQLLQKLLNKCVQMRVTERPWGKDANVVVNGRCYHESYPDVWVSYSHNGRRTFQISDYQWRAPAEWFAELYAYSWRRKWEPPSFIPKEIRKYMWAGPAK